MSESDPLTMAEVVRSVSSLAAVAIAVFAFRITKALAIINPNKEINSMWNSFNSIMLQGENARIFSEFFDRNLEDQLAPYDPKLNFLLFSFFNCLHLEYVTWKGRLMRDSHYQSSMEKHFLFMSPRIEYIIQLLDANGYDPGFTGYLKSRFEAENSTNDSGSGAVIPWWLRT